MGWMDGYGWIVCGWAGRWRRFAVLCVASRVCRGSCSKQHEASVVIDSRSVGVWSDETTDCDALDSLSLSLSTLGDVCLALRVLWAGPRHQLVRHPSLARATGARGFSLCWSDTGGWHVQTRAVFFFFFFFYRSPAASHHGQDPRVVPAGAIVYYIVQRWKAVEMVDASTGGPSRSSWLSCCLSIRAHLARCCYCVPGDNQEH
jgi:hypothetical protein